MFRIIFIGNLILRLILIYSQKKTKNCNFYPFYPRQIRHTNFWNILWRNIKRIINIVKSFPLCSFGCWSSRQNLIKMIISYIAFFYGIPTAKVINVRDSKFVCEVDKPVYILGYLMHYAYYFLRLLLCCLVFGKFVFDW